MNKQYDDFIVSHLRKRSRELCPDYPGIQNDLDPWEHLWALTSYLEGTSLANDDCHEVIKFLCAKLHMTPIEAWEMYKKEMNHEKGTT